MQILTRLPARSLCDRAELTFIARQAIAHEALLAQHARYRETLIETGATVRVLPAWEDQPDSVFVEDAAVVVAEVAVLGRSGAVSRREEPEALREILSASRPVIALREPATLDGGDVLRVDRTLYVGLSTRTNLEAVTQLRDALGPHGYVVRPVPLGASLHLKTACTALDDETVLFNPAWVDPSVVPLPRRIAIDPGEPFAANVLRLGDDLIVNAAFPITAERVMRFADREGYRAFAVDLSEFGKAEAGLTCLSLPLP
jgi:dimethylargininase